MPNATTTLVGTDTIQTLTGKTIDGNSNTLSNIVTTINGTSNQIDSSSTTGTVTLSIPSSFVAPGSINSTTDLFAGTLFYEGTTPEVRASGSTQEDATPITTSYSIVVTADKGTGVILPNLKTPGANITIVNKSTNTINVYPNIGGTIDSGDPTIIPVNSSSTYISSSETQWYTVSSFPSSSSGTGTVTSVNMTVPNILTISGNPITTSGTLSLSLAAQSANTIFAGPSSGAVATPTFRTLVADDNKIGWMLLTSVISESNAINVTTPSFSARRYLRIECRIAGYNTSAIALLRFNGDTGGNYSFVRSDNTTAVSSGTGQTGIRVAQTAITGTRYFTANIRNVSNQAKVVILEGSSNSEQQNQAPTINHVRGVWDNNNSQITSITLNGGGTTTTLTAGTEIYVYGSN